MDYSNNVILLEVSPIIVQPGAETQTAAEVTVPSAAQDPYAADQQAGWGSLIPMLLFWAVAFIAMYLLIFRPQRKRDKEMKTMQQNIRPGDNVVTASGFYGKVMDVGEDVFVIEFGTNRGIRVPVMKSEVMAIRVPKMTPPPATPKE